MAKVEINVALPTPDAKASLEVAEVAAKTATGNEVVIKKAFENKDNTLFIVAEGSGSIVVKKGDCYPSAILGDSTVPVTSLAVINFADLARFENKDNTVVLDCKSYTGKVFAIAKRVGLAPIS